MLKMIKREEKLTYTSQLSRANLHTCKTVYTWAKTIPSETLTIKTLDNKDILNNMNNSPCNYTTSPFSDPNHGHFVTRDIHIIENNKLRKRLCLCFAKVSNTKDLSPLLFQTKKLKYKIAWKTSLLIGAIKRESLSNTLHNG